MAYENQWKHLIHKNNIIVYDMYGLLDYVIKIARKKNISKCKRKVGEFSHDWSNIVDDNHR